MKLNMIMTVAVLETVQEYCNSQAWCDECDFCISKKQGKRQRECVFNPSGVACCPFEWNLKPLIKKYSCCRDGDE